jgi:hypothetical protein
LPRRRVVDRALRLLGRPAAPAAVVELSVVPREVAVEIVQANGARVVDVVEDGAAGGGQRSARYCVVRD